MAQMQYPQRALAKALLVARQIPFCLELRQTNNPPSAVWQRSAAACSNAPLACCVQPVCEQPWVHDLDSDLLTPDLVSVAPLFGEGGYSGG